MWESTNTANEDWIQKLVRNIGVDVTDTTNLKS